MQVINKLMKTNVVNIMRSGRKIPGRVSAGINSGSFRPSCTFLDFPFRFQHLTVNLDLDVHDFLHCLCPRCRCRFHPSTSTYAIINTRTSTMMSMTIRTMTREIRGFLGTQE